MLSRITAFVVIIMTASVAAARPAPGSFAPLVENLSPAVVNISTTMKVEGGGGLPFKFDFRGMPDEADPFRDFFEKFQERFGQQQSAPHDVTSLGSGFVIDPDGYIVTNNHVVEKADEIVVNFQDESQYEAKIVGRDAKTDLALLKIEAAKPLPYVEFGDSDELRVGDWVVAIGNPFGLGGSVSAGIVSARSRNINAGPFDDFIQTDAAINRGNSGGPLFDMDGKVVGVNSAIYTPTGGNVGIGFSIPSALAEPVLNQLREHGKTQRGWLGVKIQHVTEELADSLGLKKPHGALVLEVTEGSPAADAGIKAGDIILSFDGKDVKEMRDLPRMVAETTIGKRVDVEVWRDEDDKDFKVTLGELNEEEEVAEVSKPDAPETEKSRSTEWMGSEVAALTRELREQLRLDADASGVVVVRVQPGTPAFEARLQPRDIITQANQKPVTSVKDLRDAVAAAKKDGKEYALLRVMRRGEMSFVTIATKE
jgi:serine protease Do